MGRPTVCLQHVPKQDLWFQDTHHDTARHMPLSRLISFSLLTVQAVSAGYFEVCIYVCNATMITHSSTILLYNYYVVTFTPPLQL